MSSITSYTKFSTNKRLIFWCLKTVVIILLGVVIFKKIITYESAEEIFLNFKLKLAVRNNWPFLVLCILLMFVNWGLETFKWQLLIRPFHYLSFLEASKSILVGLSLGIVTPSRVGEYGGRIIGIPNDLKAQGLKAHFLSSLSQNIVNITAGCIGAFVFLTQYYIVSSTFIVAIVTIGLVFSLLLLSLFYGNDYVIRFAKTKLPSRWTAKIDIGLSTYNESQVLNRAVLISSIRYVIFVSQYVLLLYYFGLDIPLLAMVSGVTLIYLIQSGIPLPPFISMLARGEIAIVIWSIFSASALSILSATFTLWILNLLLPALVGSIILVRKS